MKQRNRDWLTKDIVAVEVAAWLICLFSLVAAVFHIANNTESVPVHFGIDGTPDRWGSPVEFLALPVIILTTNLAISIIVHFVDPKYWNRPGTLREGEETDWYRMSARVCVWSELYIALFTLMASLDVSDGDASTVLPLSIILVVAIIATSAALIGRFYIGRSKK